MPPAKKKKPPGTSPGKTPAPMPAGGDSNDWVKGKANHKRIGTCFLAHSQSSRWGLIWDEVPEAEMCENDFWGSLATYVCEIYEIEAGLKNAGKGLASSTAAGVWSGLIEDMKIRFSKSTSSQTKVRTPRTHAAHASTRPNMPNVPNVPARTGCRPASAQDFLRCSLRVTSARRPTGTRR